MSSLTLVLFVNKQIKLELYITLDHYKLQSVNNEFSGV